MKVYLSLTVITFCLFGIGCAYTSESYKSYDQFLILNRDFKLSSHSCKIILKDSIDDNYLYLVKFDKVSGGGTYFLGKRIKGGNGFKSKRLQVVSTQNEIHSFSINDFKNLSMDTIDLNRQLKN